MSKIQLFKFHSAPEDFAISKTGAFDEGRSFFLDFSRPLEVLRWLGVTNKIVGVPVFLLVPVLHQGQSEGKYITLVGRSDPYFKDLRTFWKERYPSKRQAPVVEADGIQIISDFAKHFPEDVGPS